MATDFDDRPASESRRLLLRVGAVAVGAGLLGVPGAVLSPAAMAQLAPIGGGEDGTGAGADGEPAPAGTTLDARQLAAEPTDSTSYNGWTVGTPASVIGVQNYAVPGTSVVLPIRSGDVATVLLYVARRFNAEVEALVSGQCWGYSYRANVNNPSVWSNHASGTAIDLNSLKHPNGASGTFTAAKKAAVRQILAYCGEVVYWGEDYRGTIDGMHFEIDVPPSSPALGLLARKIRGEVADPLGRLDGLNHVGNNTVTFEGWAFDPDDSTAEISVAVYVDGAGLAWFPTGVARADVNKAYGIGGKHGFSGSTKLSPGSHVVTVYAINVAGGTTNPVIGSRTVQVGFNPKGNLDGAVALSNSVRLTGWAYDPDNPTAEIAVTAYRDGVGIGWFPTSQPRSDVNQAFGISGKHGFDFTVDAPRGRGTFTVYAMNISGGDTNTTIGSRQVVVGASPDGNIDAIWASGRTVRIQGWALDLDQPNTEISVAVYRGAAGIGWFPTGVPRSDVSTAFGIRGNHGFDISIADVPPGDHSFAVYAINVGPDGGNPMVATRSLRVN